jgi:phosphoribulokinase
MRAVCDVRVFLAPPEELRRKWKVNRDCSRRGYTTDQVLAELDKREDDSVSFIRPQERYADLVVSFNSGDPADADHLDAQLILRDGLPHPDLSSFVDVDAGMTLTEGDGELLLRIPGRLDAELAGAVEQAIWEKMHFASHLRSQRLGEFTVGTDLHRSESLALVQLLILYHMVNARATVALGGDGGRSAARSAPASADDDGAGQPPERTSSAMAR